MDDELYKEVVKFKKDGTLNGSRFARYRFKNHYGTDDWTLKGGLLYFKGRMVVPEAEVNSILRKFYDNPKTTSNGKLKFYAIVSKHTFGITFEEVSAFLDNQEAYQLHKPAPKLRVVKPIVRNGSGDYYQIDLIIMSKLAPWNNGYENILTCVDVFSKKAWAYPLKTKNSSEVAANMKKIVNESPNLKVVQSDNGTEFKGELDDLLNENGIKHQLSRTYTAQSNGGVEKFNGTLKSMIYQHLTKFNTKVYVDVLPSLVENYNSRVHGTTKEVPDDIFALQGEHSDKVKNEEVKERIVKAASGSSKYNNRLNKSNAVKVGDRVRVLKTVVPGSGTELKKKQLAGIGYKSYEKKWSDQVYEVTKVQTLKGYKLISVADTAGKDLGLKLHIDEIQVIDFDKTVPANQKHGDLSKYGIDAMVTREDNVKKAQEARVGRGLESKVETSNYDLRTRRSVKYV